jgi:hypothetical protein
MTAQIHRLAARGFVEANLSRLSADVLYWRKHGKLPLGSTMAELASLCVAFAAEGDEFQEAERMIIQFALTSASRNSYVQGESVATPADPTAAPELREGEAYRSLLPKLLSLADKIDDMSDEEYRSWLNALPKEEFFEFMGLDGKDEFRAAVAEARALVHPGSSSSKSL